MSGPGLAGRVAIVTGATSGIGEATVRHLVEGGARVVANARREERLRALERVHNHGDGVRVATVAGDASRDEVIQATLATAEAAFGATADLVVVNAGRGLTGSASSSDPGEWEAMVRVNFLGCVRMLRAAGERMLRLAGEGNGTRPLDIVVLGSSVGRHISPFSSVYGATKAAVGSIAEAARRELGPRGIRVTLVEPGIVASEFQQVAGYDRAWFDSFAERIGPVLTPDDIARLIVFVAAQPPHVHINDVVIRPTRQDYP
ncbi:MAG TPA: SDR family oxidoreductase [Longimicrobiaceae bacterium]|nr:SDR family oxidoreductase [Longimicrobiaceae bacterium]